MPVYGKVERGIVRPPVIMVPVVVVVAVVNGIPVVPVPARVTIPTVAVGGIVARPEINVHAKAGPIEPAVPMPVRIVVVVIVITAT